MMQLAPLRTRWTAGQRSVAFAQIAESRRAAPDDPRTALVHGFMAVALGRAGEGVDSLRAAAGHRDTRAAALVGLAARADDRHVEQLLALCHTLPAAAREHDRVRYAEGLLLWRAGERARALATWSRLSDAARQALDEPLTAANVAFVGALIDQGELGEATLRLEAVARARTAAMTRHEQRGWRALALRAHARGLHRLARAAAVHLQDSAEPVDRALVVVAADSGVERARALACAAQDTHLPAGFRRFVRRLAVAELIRHGDPAGALAALGEPGDDPGLVAVVCLLRGAVGVPCRAWPAIRRAFAGEPERFQRLLGTPPVGASDEQRASFWGERGDLDRAFAHLAVASGAGAPALARQLVAVACARALAAAPERVAEAWRDCFAWLCALLENPPRLERWIRERLGVYDIQGDPHKVAEELRLDAYREVDRSLSELRADQGDATSLKAELARERAAAAAMWSSPGFYRDREKQSFGPLYARRTGMLAPLTEWLAEARHEVSRGQHASLIRDLEGLGRSEQEIERILAAGAPDPRRELRRWFCELGEASALKSAGEAAAAKQVALRIYSVWTPPLSETMAVFAARNPGYGADPRAVELLRQDAAAMACELELAKLTAQLGAGSFDVKGLRIRLTAILREAAAFGCEDDTRMQLSRLLLGKQRQLLAFDTLEASRAATVIGREALAAGLTGAEQRQTEALNVHARHLACRRRFRAAASAYEEAWRLRPRERGNGSSWIVMLLRHHERLLGQQRDDEAASVLAEIEQALKAVRDACGRDAVEDLSLIVDEVRRGAPLARVARIKEFAPGKAPPPLRDGLTEALAGVRAAFAGPTEALLAALVALLERFDRHPQAILKVIEVVAPTLVRGAPTDAAAVIAWFDGAIEEQLARYPQDAALSAARAEVDRVRPVAVADDPLAQLHAKALRLVEAGEYAPAVDILQTLFHLRPDHDVELCILLAESLAGHFRALRQRDRELAEQRRATAVKVLTLASKLAPDHPRIQTIQALFAAASTRRQYG